MNVYLDGESTETGLISVLNSTTMLAESKRIVFELIIKKIKRKYSFF